MIAGALALTVVMALWSALNFALRFPSRAGIADEFERRGRTEQFEDFVANRLRHALATAVVRTVAQAALWLTVLRYAGVSFAEPVWPRIIALFALCWLLSYVFGVAIPAAWAKYAGGWLVVNLLPLLAATRIICEPLLLALDWIDPLIRRLAGVPAHDDKSYADTLEQEILHAVTEGELHGAVDEEEKEMIESVIELTDTRVEEIMTPRTDIVALSQDADLDQVLDTIRKKGHSRIPVYDGTIDNVLGILYAKDLLRRDATENFALERVMRKALYIPETKLVRDLLREFQAQKVHIAIVLDEYGGTAGLLTVEDIVEELVGEIADEYETGQPAEIRRVDDNTVEVDARMRIDDLNDELHINLPEDGDFETIGGFVFSLLGKIPKPGEECAHENIGIRVMAAEPRRITRVRLDITPAADNGHDREP